MTTKTLLEEQEAKGISRQGPYLSHARVNRYLHCPEQYRLYYVENLRPRYPSASLVFGQVVHQALACLFRDKGDPQRFFLQAWGDVQQMDLTYGQKDSWKGLLTKGQQLLGKFVEEALPRLSNVTATEKVFTLDITSLDLPFVGIIDLVADLDGKRTVVDFKTSASAYKEHEALMSDQLTAYSLAEPETEQAALCVLVKAAEPKIVWHLTDRKADQVVEYLMKVQLVGREIEAGRFYKRPGTWCGWCDYLPVCLGNAANVREALVQIS